MATNRRGGASTSDANALVIADSQGTAIATPLYPLAAPIWMTGLVVLWRRDGGRWRPLAWAWATVLLLVVAGGGKAYYLTPFYPVLFAAVDNVQAGAGQLEDGTAIGTAIATSANRLRAAGGRSRVMVLLTDGENNRGAIDPRTAADAAAAFDVRIYTIGVGSEGSAPVPVSKGVFGLRYENRPVRIDEGLLEDIADVGHRVLARQREGPHDQRPLHIRDIGAVGSEERAGEYQVGSLSSAGAGTQ